jgi:hypothetical protein
MKTLKIILLISLFAAPAALLAQATEKGFYVEQKRLSKKNLPENDAAYREGQH